VQSTSRRQNLEETTSPTRPKEQVEVIKRIEEDIIFGCFAPGSRLVEDTLMARIAPPGVPRVRVSFN
jgi:DNA-binding GntR family transcriptional regulator